MPKTAKIVGFAIVVLAGAVGIASCSQVSTTEDSYSFEMSVGRCSNEGLPDKLSMLCGEYKRGEAAGYSALADLIANGPKFRTPSPASEAAAELYRKSIEAMAGVAIAPSTVSGDNLLIRSEKDYVEQTNHNVIEFNMQENGYRAKGILSVFDAYCSRYRTIWKFDVEVNCKAPAAFIQEVNRLEGQRQASLGRPLGN